VRDDLIPTSESIFDWIETIFRRGIRRPGYAANRWAADYSAERFRALGLERVRLEPVQLPYWESRRYSLRVRGGGGEQELPCFPLPHTAPTPPITLELEAYDAAAPARVRGKAALCDVRLLRIPPATFAAGEPSRVFDARATFAEAVQVLPFGAEIQHVMEPAIEAGAAAYIGVLADYPGDSCEYYVPYDAVARPIPGLWVRGSDGALLHTWLRSGSVQVYLHIDAVREEITSYNVVGELAGADAETVVVGSHHDGPWSSAVEDASGMALVYAQAEYWSRLPASQRPHRLTFLLNAGHMAGGAGCRAFLAAHAAELERIVLEVHLEHAAAEFVERGGALVASGEPEPRWLFTSRIPRLEAAVRQAIAAEGLDRALILPPDALGPHPTTDGGFFHLHGVPLVNYLTAPFYLFDAMDTLDKIHRPSLAAITRATIRLIESTAGISAAMMRASDVQG
jgi:peptidase M28-like protein